MGALAPIFEMSQPCTGQAVQKGSAAPCFSRPVQGEDPLLDDDALQASRTACTNIAEDMHQLSERRGNGVRDARVTQQGGEFSLGCANVPELYGLVHGGCGQHAVVVLAPVRRQNLISMRRQVQRRPRLPQVPHLRACARTCLEIHHSTAQLHSLIDYPSH